MSGRFAFHPTPNRSTTATAGGDERMAAPAGNRFWEARSSHGRAPIFASPEELWSACLEYFEWVESNPLYEARPFAYQGVVVQEPVAKMRAMTIMGLCNFLDISVDAWALYRGREDFIGVVSRAEQIMRQQKFEGASADLLNPNIIARDLGLADKQEQSGTIQHQVTADDAFATFIATLGGHASAPAGGGDGKGEVAGESETKPDHA